MAKKRTVFMSTRSNINKTALDPSVDRASAIALLHNHGAFIDFQPLVISKDVIELPSTDWIATEASSLAPAGAKPEYWSVTIRVPFPPFGTKEITAISAYIDTDEGSIIVFQVSGSNSGGFPSFFRDLRSMILPHQTGNFLIAQKDWAFWSSVLRLTYRY